MNILAIHFTFLKPIYLHFHGGHDEVILYLYFIVGYRNTFRVFYSTQFLVATLTVKTRFAVLNNFLKGSKNKTKFNCVVTPNFRKIYLQLCDGIEIINETFTLHFSFIFGIFMVSFVNVKVNIFQLFLVLDQQYFYMLQPRYHALQ